MKVNFLPGSTLAAAAIALALSGATVAPAAARAHHSATEKGHCTGKAHCKHHRKHHKGHCATKHHCKQKK